jgi:hypothetical protein
MDRDLKHFIVQLAAVAVGALAVVALVAFVSIPWSLQRHPGEPAEVVNEAPRHMT